VLIAVLSASAIASQSGFHFDLSSQLSALTTALNGLAPSPAQERTLPAL
jgi:hypothetical protein